MNLLLAVLLYLHVINASGTYTQSYINAQSASLNAQITAVESDSSEMQEVDDVCMPMVSTIVIIDDNIGS